jgi:hypothetical protein
MSFIEPDEFVILMDQPGLLSVDNLKRVRDEGVRTLYAYVSWQQVERVPGVLDWASADAWVERARSADMKVLLRCYDQAPAFFPDDWYLRTAVGEIWRDIPGWGGTRRHTLLSPWCLAAMDAEQDFMRACQEHYGSNGRVQVYAGVAHDGEVLLPGMVASYYDPHALASFRDYSAEIFGRTRSTSAPVDLPTRKAMDHPATTEWLSATLFDYVAVQQEPFPEIWLSLVERNTPFAEAVECGPRSGNWLMRQFCRDLPDKLDKALNVVLFEVYREGGTQGALENVRGFEDRTWVGSQFCEGLWTNTDDAIGRGLRGFITAPVYPDQSHATFEPWKLEAIRWALGKWRERRL